jgi:general secretion pathway protein G
MYQQKRKAFTMLELVFVIVIIGVLSAVAIPKFAINRDDAVIAKGKNVVSSVRSAIAMERQKRILKGKFTRISTLSSSTNYNADIFDAFDGNISNPVLSYPMLSCKNNSATGCWKVRTQGAGTTDDPTVYVYKMPLGDRVLFHLKNNQFVCVHPRSSNCKLLTR